MSPPSPSSAGSAANGGGARSQPDPPSNGSGEGGGAVDPPIATSRLRGTTPRGENVSSGSTATQSPPSVSSALSSIGGEPLAGSGFETQTAQRGFAPTLVNPSDAGPATGSVPSSPPPMPSGTIGDAMASSSIEGTATSNSTSPGGSGVVSDVTSVGSTGPTNPQQPANAKAKSGLARAADQVRGFRRRLGSLPSDAAPHATPPRIPLDHEE